MLEQPGSCSVSLAVSASSPERMVAGQLFIALANFLFNALRCRYRVAHKNVPNFAMMLYCSTIEFKQKETILLKRNHN